MMTLVAFVGGVIVGVVYHAYLNPYVTALIAKVRSFFPKKEG